MQREMLKSVASRMTAEWRYSLQYVQAMAHENAEYLGARGGAGKYASILVLMASRWLTST